MRAAGNRSDRVRVPRRRVIHATPGKPRVSVTCLLVMIPRPHRSCPPTRISPTTGASRYHEEEDIAIPRFPGMLAPGRLRPAASEDKSVIPLAVQPRSGLPGGERAGGWVNGGREEYQ